MNELIRVKIYGLNLSRLINRLISYGVLLNDVIAKDKFILFSLRMGDKNLLDKVCEIEKKQYVIVRRFGIINCLKRVPYLFGGVFAIVIVLCYLYSISIFVQDIKIVNDSNIEFDIKSVELLLNKEGVNIGSNKRRFSEKYIENIILDNFKNISGCVVKYSGVFLNIKVYPAVNEYVLKDDDLISKYDGIITSIDIYSGKTNLKVGDIVKAGDVLIQSDDGASGSVKAKVFFSSSKLYNKIQEEVVYSGKFESFKTVSIFNKIIFKEENLCKFSKYFTKKCDFYLTDKYILPVRCEEVFCFEYELKQKIVEFEEVEQEIKKDLFQETKNKLPDDFEFVNTTYSVVSEGDLTRVDCYIEAIVDLV